MSKDEFAFEERKYENNGSNLNNLNNQNEFEYHKGGGGGGNGNGFFSIKTNVYSKQCHSDPNNPGKMICKEIKNTTGFDPFNKENNYKKMNENVFTQESGLGLGANLFGKGNTLKGDDHIEEPSMFDKITNKLKGLFLESSDELEKINIERDPYKEYDNLNRQDSFRNDSHIHGNLNRQNSQSHRQSQTQSNYDHFEHNKEYARHDPFIDEFDRMFKKLQYEFFKGEFFDLENFEHEFTGHNEEFNPLNTFFNIGFNNSNFHPHQHHEHENDRDFCNEDYNEDNFSTRGHFENEHFTNFNKSPQNQFQHEEETQPEIKYSNNKIYDI